MRRHGAFTLLEVLLALVLSTVLMTALWSALSLHLRAFDSGRTQVEEAQLARALLRQIARDVRGAVYQPSSASEAWPSAGAPLTASATPLASGTTETPEGGTSLSTPGESLSATVVDDTVSITESVAAPGLIGTDRDLQVDVLRAAAEEMASVDPASLTSAADEFLAGRPPELVRVSYHLDATETVMGDSTPAAYNGRGLWRRQTAWMAPELLEDPFASLAAEGQPGDHPTGADPLAISGDEELPPGEQRLLVPEVVALGFRYFDGQAWTEFWDSAQQERLPRAIEITLVLRPSSDPRARHRAGQNHARDGLASIDDGSTWPQYRLVVSLPTASQRPAALSTSGDATSAAAPSPWEAPPQSSPAGGRLP